MGRYRWKRKDRRFRRRRVRQAAKRGMHPGKPLLFCLLFLAAVAAVKELSEAELTLVQREELCCAEWRRKAELPEEGDIYGFRFDPAGWKLEFYHRSERLTGRKSEEGRP